MARISPMITSILDMQTIVPVHGIVNANKDVVEQATNLWSPCCWKPLEFCSIFEKSLISPLAINAALFWLHCVMIQPSLDHKP